MEIHPALHELAARWSTYPDQTKHLFIERKGGFYVQRWEIVPIRRCCVCHEEVYQSGPGTGTLAHLMLSHGYRMNGYQYDGKNRCLGRA